LAEVRITDRDLELLRFLAEHRLLLAEQVGALLGVSVATAERRLRALTSAGYLRRERLYDRKPSCYQITRDGLSAIGSDLPVPRLDLRSYEHDLGLGWLWLAARAGRFGELSGVRSERELRSNDGRTGAEGTLLGREDPLAVRLGGSGPGGRRRLHYPDLLLRTRCGHTVAVELELTSKGRTRREKILAGYAGDPRFDAVVYLVERGRVGDEVSTSARRLGISRMVHVQRVARATGARPVGGRVRMARRAAAPEAAR
jgi:DNA-binding MarR family transcriptional regulator